MKLEDNFINLGNRKFENKFAIKSDDVGVKGQAINTTGKVIRFSGRNMTATDAMVQAPNLIADIVYMSFLEAKRQGLKGEDIGKFINKHKMAVLEWYAQNGGTELEPLTKDFTSCKETSKVCNLYTRHRYYRSIWTVYEIWR